VTAAGAPPKRIEEYVGRIITGTPQISIARMVSPAGWSEPYQTPAWDEYSVVLSGKLQIETNGEVLMVLSGQAVLIPAGSKVRYSTPEGAEYIAVCLPAFSPDLAHRGEEEKQESKLQASVDEQYEIHAAGPEETDRIEKLWKQLRMCIISRNKMFGGQMRKVRFHDRKNELLQKNDDRLIRIFFAIDTLSGDDIGYCFCSAAPGSFGEIESIFVCEKARHRGIGTTLMVHALTWIKEQGSRDIRVHVTVGNEDVIPFYQKFGLHPRQYILSYPGEL
ncbi:GNAT family N-acetyltransferase, partial [Methanospirillum sp.]